MRSLLLVFLPAMLWAQGGAPVEGVVVSTVTHAGLAGVAVNVESVTGRHVTYTTATGADGSFRIGNIDQDGEYLVRYSRSGYREPAPGKPVRVAAATGVVRLQAELTPLPQLRGRVLDAEGRPVPKARVELIGVGGNWVVGTTTMDDGSFVYQNALPSSSFVLRASPPKEFPAPPATEAESRIWAPTYYPDGTDRSQALKVAWRGDADLDGYQIKLRAVQVFHVRGMVVDETGKPAEGAAVKLAPGDPSMPVMLALGQPEAKAVTQKDGTFDLAAVRPGEWMLAAEWKQGDQALSGFVKGKVSRGDWEDVRIEMQVPFSVKGVVEVPDTADGQRGGPRGLVILTPANRSEVPADSTGPAGADGHFEIRNVFPGRYRITGLGLGNRYYLDSVQFGGREVLGQSVDVMDGTLPIRLVYKANGGRVLGSVEHCAAVTLFPADLGLRTNDLIRTVRCDAGGRFEIAGLRPGDYFAVAMGIPNSESLDQALDEMLFDPESAGISQLVGSAESVRVEGGQSSSVALRLATWPER